MDRRNDGQSAAMERANVAALKGMALPRIALPATTGGTVMLADLKGRSVLYCYTWTGRPGIDNPPHWDDIPGAHGSTPQTESYRDHHAEFTALGVSVFGLSTQTSEFQKEMVKRLCVPFPVLGDADLGFATALQLPTFVTGGTTYLKRLTMIVADGVIERVVYPVAQPERDAPELLKSLAREYG